MRWGGGSRRRDDGGGDGPAAIVFLAIWLVAVVLAPLVAQVLAMMVSRRREYLADASGAELTRNPLGLARALEKIEGGRRVRRWRSNAARRICASPIRSAGGMNLKEGFWPDLFASHPPMAARIAALKGMAYEH